MINTVLAATIIVSGGISASDHMGEKSPGMLAQVVSISDRVESRVFFDSIDKLETEDGHILGADCEYRKRSGFSLVVGVGLRQRVTSRWQKDSIWGRLGASYGPFKAVLVHDFNSINSVTGGEFGARVCSGRICAEQRFGAYSYLQSGDRMNGYASETVVGIRLGGKVD